MNRIIIAVALTGLIGAVGLLVLRQSPAGDTPASPAKPGPGRKGAGSGTTSAAPETEDPRRAARLKELCGRLARDAKHHAELARQAAQKAQVEGTKKRGLELDLKRGMDGQRRVLQTSLIGKHEAVAQKAAAEVEKEAALVREMAQALEDVRQCGGVAWAIQETEALAKSAREIAGKEATYRPAEAP